MAQVLQLVPGPPPLLLLSPVKAGALGLPAPPEVFHLDGLDDVLQPGQDEDAGRVVDGVPSGRLIGCDLKCREHTPLSALAAHLEEHCGEQARFEDGETGEPIAPETPLRDLMERREGRQAGRNVVAVLGGALHN